MISEKKSNETEGGRFEVVRILAASENVCDRRKGHDLAELFELSRGKWKDRFWIFGLGRGERRSLVVLCLLRGVRSLIWENGVSVGDSFKFALTISYDYPLSLPGITFLGSPIPFNPHVIDERFLPVDSASLSPELRAYMYGGRGRACYLRASQWNASEDNLAVCVWQMSRILAGTVYPEEVSLNPKARDFMLQRKDAVREEPELGPPLPYPVEAQETGTREAFATEEEDGGDALEWVEEEEKENGA